MAQLLDAVFPHADTVPVFVSLNELPDGEVLTASICVIGGGAAGISIAMEFIGSGIDVTVLESGGFEYDDDIHQLTMGENVGLHYYDLDTARLRYFGGFDEPLGGSVLSIGAQRLFAAALGCR